MPQLPDNRVPSANTNCSDRELRPAHLAEYEKFAEKRQDGPTTSPGVSAIRQTTARTTSALGRPGLFNFDWQWQLAGLIAAIVSGIALMGISFHPQWGGFPIGAFLGGIALASLALYCGFRTKWLKEATTAPLGIKIGTGTAIICGLCPIVAAILYAALMVLAAAAMIWVMAILLQGALSGGK